MHFFFPLEDFFCDLATCTNILKNGLRSCSLKVFPGMSHWEETPQETLKQMQNSLKKSRLDWDTLGSPRMNYRISGIPPWTCCPGDLISNNQRTMDGWMDPYFGWRL
ncbi:hypothetical protein AMECASPLE_023032 [Ameca splendens]|uniref:Uncharacterized protein n=1 Tax=Ameca splendens TaxID=208324 RepID=A0ABV0YF17_9TELE